MSQADKSQAIKKQSSKSRTLKIGLTRKIKYPNKYVQALSGSYKDWAFDEESAPSYKGKWLSAFSNEKALSSCHSKLQGGFEKKILGRDGLSIRARSKEKKRALDLEIGPGTGTHFTRLCLDNPDRCFLALEIKYKPLIQTLRRARKKGITNMRGIRYNAKAIGDLFEKNEIHNIYLHFPDPWLKKRSQKKHQLIQPDFCGTLYEIQKASSFLDFKTDSLEYFENSLRHFKKAGYQIEAIDPDLYSKEPPVSLGGLSQFELIFVKKREAVRYARLSKKL